MELQRQSGQLDINIEDNVDFALHVTYKVDGAAVNVDGYTAKFELRDVPGQTGEALLSLTETAGITVGTTDGTFIVEITETQANFGDREMVYDLIVISTTGEDERLLRGICKSWSGVSI